MHKVYKSIPKNVFFSSLANVLPKQYEHHTPVMSKEVLKALAPKSGETIVDMTFGAGGHTKQILDAVPNIKMICLDRDPVAYNFAKELSDKYPGQIIPLLGRFSELPELLASHNVESNSIDGFLFDFGCSSMQFDVGERGFSISKDGPLDMRMDGSRCLDQPTAADVLARASEEDIAKIIKIYGEEKQYKKIARAIVDARYTFRRLERTSELVDLINSVCEDEIRHDKLNRFSNVATKTFQALRIFINNELNEINYAMLLAKHYLKIHGRMVTISFHSLEDTIVKRHIMGHLVEGVANALPLKFSDPTVIYDKYILQNMMKSPWKSLYKHVLVPSDEEVDINPRSRSARLRAAIKVE